VAGVVLALVGLAEAERPRVSASDDAAIEDKMHVIDKVVTSMERVNDVFGPHSLTLPAPISRWDNAIPLGNRLTGGLLWGERNNLKLSLDRGDLWDVRTKIDFDPAQRTFATFIECYKNQDRETWDRVFLAANRSIRWTKIPGGRLKITLPESLQSESFHLDFEKATAKVTFSDGTHPNFDQALLLWSAAALEEMATAQGKTEDAEKWAALKAKLAPLKFDEKTGALLVGEGVPFSHSHRHFSHTLAIHPLGILNVDQSEEAREAVRASVRQILDQSHRGWTGYSFTWAASLAARAGFAADALRHLVDFERAFVARNGFHLNGDQTWTILPRQKRRGSRAFTLEGNFLFMDAIHEMYLQSFDGTVRVFPTMPESWKDAEFRELRAEGGFRVSARRAEGVTTEVEISATCDGVLKLRDPFPGGEAKWSIEPQHDGDCLLFKLKAGSSVDGRRPELE